MTDNRDDPHDYVYLTDDDDSTDYEEIYIKPLSPLERMVFMISLLIGTVLLLTVVAALIVVIIKVIQ